MKSESLELIEKIDRSNLSPPLYCLLRASALFLLIAEQLGLFIKARSPNQILNSYRIILSAYMNAYRCAQCFARRFLINENLYNTILTRMGLSEEEQIRFFGEFMESIDMISGAISTLNLDEISKASKKLKTIIEEALALAKSTIR